MERSAKAYAMKDEQVQRLVAEVIARLAVRLGADGRRGLLIGVCTGATVDLGQAAGQLRNLIWQGHRLRLCFSKAAEGLCGQVIEEQLAGLPHVARIDPAQWLKTLQEARAVVVPLLSVNTLSKLALLLADNLPTNLILHALFMGKPVIIARNGADRRQPGRRRLQFDKGNRTLQGALLERLDTIGSYGCTLTDTGQLSATVTTLLGESLAGKPQAKVSSYIQDSSAPAAEYKVVTAARVAHAHRQGENLRIAPGMLVTPLARELASRLGVDLLKG